MGAATYWIGGIDQLVRALVVIGAERGGKMAARRESKNADFLRIDIPLQRVLPDVTHRALRVLQKLQRRNQPLLDGGEIAAERK